jgi:nicotinate-nucleotide adenylyltransferase
VTDRRIGVFGGTFDPVHNGHLRVALDALELLGLAEVRLIPLARAVHREQPETPARLRIAMLEAAVAGQASLLIDRREIERDGPSYTIETLQSLHQSLPASTLCLLLGGDAFNGFLNWRAPDSILDLANIVILARPDSVVAPAVQELYDARRVTHLEPGRTGQIIHCPVTQLAIASSDIRARCAERRSIDFLVPDAVLSIIKQQRLYC